MPIPTALCTEAGLTTALGGSQAAAKLMDERKTGKPWSVIVTAAIQWGTTRVLMAYGVRQDASALTEPYPASLVQMAERFAAAEAWRLSGKGDAMPPEIAANEKICEDLCTLLVESKRTTAASPEPANQQSVIQIDPDPEGTGWTRKGSKGLW